LQLNLFICVVIVYFCIVVVVNGCWYHQYCVLVVITANVYICILIYVVIVILIVLIVYIVVSLITIIITIGVGFISIDHRIDHSVGVIVAYN
jgi:hypothetical protein